MIYYRGAVCYGSVYHFLCHAQSKSFTNTRFELWSYSLLVLFEWITCVFGCSEAANLIGLYRCRLLFIRDNCLVNVNERSVPGYLTVYDSVESCTVMYPGSHAQWGILVRGVMHSEVSWSVESCTVRCPGPGSHAQWGILVRGVMHSEVSWPWEVMYSEVSWSGESCTVRYPGPGESCTVRYPGPWSHAQWCILGVMHSGISWGVMHSEVSWSVESCTVRYSGPGSHIQ